MRVHLIGIHYDSSGKNIIGFRILDATTGKYMDVPYNNVVDVIKAGKAEIVGIELSRGKLKGSNGSFDRYPKLVNGSLVRNSVIILRELGDAGYTVCDGNGNIKNLKVEDVIKVASTLGIANGKLVERGDGTIYISAISGTYERVELKKEVNKVDDSHKDKANDNKKDTSKKELDVKKKALLSGNLKDVDDEIKVTTNKDLLSQRNRVALPVIPGVGVSEEESKLKEFDEKSGMTVEQKLTKAFLVLRKTRPYYYAVLANVRRIEANPEKDGVSTMGVTVKSLYYNSEFVKNLSMSQLLFVLIHETLHIAMQHSFRKRARMHELWNVACDLYINKLICSEFGINPESTQPTRIENDDYNVGIEFAHGGLYNENVDVEKDTPEKIYEELLNNMLQNNSQMQGGGGQGGGQGTGIGGDGSNNSSSSDNTDGNGGGKGNGSKDSTGSQGGSGDSLQEGDYDITFRGKSYGRIQVVNATDIFDDAESAQMSDTQKQNAGRQVVERASVLAKQITQAGGHVDGYLERFIEEMLAPKVNWVSLLKNKLTKASQTVTTYAKPDKRFLSRNMIMPGPKKLDNDTLEGVKVCIDTSGSISDQDLGVALAQIKQLLDTFKAEAEVIYWDTAVRQVAPFKDIKELLKVKPLGGGGTDANCIFRYFDGPDYKRGKKKPPSIIIVFTDGCFGEIEEKYKKYRDTIWVINGGYKFNPPFGTVAKLQDVE